MPVCTKCGETKGPKAFYKDKASPKGLHLHCKLCKKAADLALKARARDEYDLSYSQYLILAKNPEDKCPHCGKPNLISHKRGFRICGWCGEIATINRNHLVGV